MQAPLDLRLARHGVIVLLLGLLTGFFINRFHNHGAADADHLVGLIGGFGLVAMGLLWPRLRLGLFWSRLGAWLMVATMYLNWLGVAVLGGLGSGPQAPSSPMFGTGTLGPGGQSPSVPGGVDLARCDPHRPGRLAQARLARRGPGRRSSATPRDEPMTVSAPMAGR